MPILIDGNIRRDPVNRTFPDGIILESGDIDLSGAGTGVYDIILRDAVADALSIRRATTDMLVFDSSTPRITITPALTVTGLITASGGVTPVRSTDGNFVSINYEYVNPIRTKGVRVAVTYTGTLFDAVGLTDSATIWTQPANSRLMAVEVMLLTPFAAPSMSSLIVSIGDAGDADGLLLATGNLVSDPGYTEYQQYGAYFASFTEGLASMRSNAAGSKAWIAYATAIGANLNTLTAGELHFVFIYEQT